MLDYMQSHQFWLLDVDPNLNPPFLVFNPTMGFSACSGVQIEMQTEEYAPINALAPVHLPGRSRPGEITLSRGARFFDTDFYRWLDRATRGVDDFRRNLLLIQLMGASLDTAKAFGAGGPSAGRLLAAGGTSLGVAGGAALLSALPFKDTTRVPGRAWILYDTIPTQYTAGALDATDGEVTIMELTVQPRVVVEVALGAII